MTQKQSYVNLKVLDGSERLGQFVFSCSLQALHLSQNLAVELAEESLVLLYFKVVLYQNEVTVLDVLIKVTDDFQPVLLIIIRRIFVNCAKNKLVLDELVDSEQYHLVTKLGDLALVLRFVLVQEV